MAGKGTPNVLQVKNTNKLNENPLSSCCIDEITAEHVGADSLIHFGHACLSQNRRLPTLYVFQNVSVEHEPVLAAFRHTFSENDKVILASDLKYNKSTSEYIKMNYYYESVYTDD